LVATTNSGDHTVQVGWAMAISASIAYSVATPVARGAILSGFDPNALLVGRMVLAAFLLLGGDAIVAGLGIWLPAGVRSLVLTTLGRTFRGYFAGQVVLALILSGAQIVVFTLLEIPYGVLFAVAIGFTTLIPYASALTIVVVSVLLALEDPRTALEVLAAAISVGQVVDQVIQPRLMGSIVGLQPAWLLVSLPIGARVGSLMGFGELLGLLLAVPLASCVKTFFDAWGERLRAGELLAEASSSLPEAVPPEAVPPAESLS
jgi:predicted PurR-regulated permease PerM